MRVFVFLASILSLAGSPAFAQMSPTDLERVRTALLQEVRLTDNAGSKQTGILQAADAETFTLLTAARTMPVPLASVHRIERRGDSLANGAVIGAVAGGAFLGLVSMLESDSKKRALSIVVGAGLWSLVGVGIDALHKGWTTVYRKP